VTCVAKQEQVSLLIDAELEEADQVTLFRHLEECSDCRLFFHSMIRFRNAAKRDQEELNLAADEILPQHSQLPMDKPRHRDDGRRLIPRLAGDGASPLERRPHGGGTRRWAKLLTGGWKLPAPMAVGLAVALLVAGALVGARVSTRSGVAGLDGPAGRKANPTVVVVCALPEVRVLGSGSHL
jgi:hypothetical protein